MTTQTDTDTDTDTTRARAEQDLAKAIAMCGEVANIFRQYNKDYPERINAIRQMILATTPPEIVEQFYHQHLATQH